MQVTVEVGVISKVHKSQTNERTFMWEGEALDPIRCAIDRKKSKRDRRPIVLRRLQIRGNLQ